MKKKFLILIEDDWEVMGNGTGNVAELQYLSALALMNIAEKYGARLTFMVEVAHQLQLKAHSEVPSIRVQSRLWDETVLMMKQRGFDVQLHLHPQWMNASYQDGHFLLGNNWNLGRCAPADQLNLIRQSVQYLNALLKPEFPEHQICAFKAGSWGLQPAAHLLEVFSQMGIGIVMGVRDGLAIPNQGTDYRGMEEKYLPYYPDKSDITRLSGHRHDVVLIPLQPYAPDLVSFSKFLTNQIRTRWQQRAASAYYTPQPVPQEVRALQPLTDKKMFSLGWRPYHTHLKIGNQPFAYLKASFDAIIHRLDQYDLPRIPVLIESHTKQFHHHYRDIEKFIAYIAGQYEAIAEFGDMSGYYRELQENPHLAKIKNES